MPGDLKQKLAVPSLVQQDAWRWAFHRQTAEHERAGRETEMGTLVFTVRSDELNGLGLPKLLVRDRGWRKKAQKSQVIRRRRAAKKWCLSPQRPW
jgi:hypothetical protein